MRLRFLSASLLLLICVVTLFTTFSHVSTIFNHKLLDVQLKHEVILPTTRPSIARVYIHYGTNASDNGVLLDGIYNATMRNNLAYDARHHYASFILQNDIYDGTWNKPVFLAWIIAGELQKADAERLKWLCWTDRDTIIMNPNIALDVFLPPTDFPSSTHVLAAKDFNGLNIGVFLVRVSTFSLRYMMETSVYRSFAPNETLTFAEQSAMASILTAHPDYLTDGSVRIVPQHWFNAYPGHRNESTGLLPFGGEHDHVTDFTEGDLLMHFPGDWKHQMGVFLEIAARHDGDWELRVDETGLLEEIDEYWQKAREDQMVIEEEKLRAEEKAREEAKVKEEEKAREEEESKKKEIELGV